MYTKILSKVLTVFIIVMMAILAFLVVVYVLDIIWDLFGWLFKTDAFTQNTELGNRKNLFNIILWDSFKYMAVIFPSALLTVIAAWVKSKALTNYEDIKELP